MNAVVVCPSAPLFVRPKLILAIGNPKDMKADLFGAKAVNAENQDQDVNGQEHNHAQAKKLGNHQGRQTTRTTNVAKNLNGIFHDLSIQNPSNQPGLFD
jgi:hypothetical protein